MAFIPAWSRGAGQPDYQRLKKRITLDVRTGRGKELLLELIKVSDVFMTNFRRNILSRWGVDFPEVRAARPDIILMWQTGLGGHWTLLHLQVLRDSGATHVRGVVDERGGERATGGGQHLLFGLPHRRAPTQRHYWRLASPTNDR